MRVIVASPTYGYVEPTCRAALMVATMTAARHGTDFIGFVAPDRMSFSDARNRCIELTLDQDPDLADGLLFVDSDIRPQPDSIWKLMRQVEEKKLDFVSGVYHHRAGEFRPCFYHMDDDGKLRNNILYEENVLKPEGASGFGFLWTSAKLILAIKSLPGFSKDQGGWFPDRRHGAETSEDLSFCKLARAAGFQLYVDTGIQVAHLGDVNFVTRETYLQSLVAKGGIPSKEVSVG